MQTFFTMATRKTTFFLHGIGDHKFQAIKASYLTHGLVPRVHGHTGRLVSHGLILADVESLVKFVMQYAEANAILLPGRMPGYKRDDIQILHSTQPKKQSGCSMQKFVSSWQCGHWHTRPFVRFGISFCVMWW